MFGIFKRKTKVQFPSNLRSTILSRIKLDDHINCAPLNCELKLVKETLGPTCVDVKIFAEGHALKS